LFKHGILDFVDRFNVGTTSGDDEVSGTITVPEVAHDTDEDGFMVSFCSMMMYF
jgi:hypothetical protein